MSQAPDLHPLLTKILIIDNFDSFTYNLADLFRCAQPQLTVTVWRNTCTVEEIEVLAPQLIVLGPGPGPPRDSGVCFDIISRFYRHLPIFGVCLGMQCLNAFYGGGTVRSRLPVHGKTSDVVHNGQSMMAGLPSPMLAARYHSLVVHPADEIDVLAWVGDCPMAIQHRIWPSFAVQFHPESFMTPDGNRLAANVMAIAEKCFKGSLSGTSRTVRFAGEVEREIEGGHDGY